jgi:DNA-binding transcriptional LysR family regulator
VLENFRLKVFRSLAKHRSFRKAGEALYISQPAVTLQIKALEDELGVKLFERRASGVLLTEAGHILLQFADKIHRLSEEAENQIANLSGGTTGELVIGASTTIAQYVLPPFLAEFARNFPHIQLQVFSENTEHVAEGVSTGRFGLGLIEGPPLRRDLKVQEWFDDELLLVVPRTHEWAGLPDVPADKLYEVPLVMRERGSGSRHVVEAGLQKAGLRLGSLRIIMELDSTEAILSCVEEGLGVGFVSQWAMIRRSAKSTLVTLRIRKVTITRNFSFIYPQTPALSNSASAMLRFLKTRMPSAHPGR